MTSATQPIYTPLDQEHRPTVGTAAAAYYLDRKPQTLHIWACKENGPIRPVRVGGRLAWPVAEIKRVLGMEGWKMTKKMAPDQKRKMRLALALLNTPRANRKTIKITLPADCVPAFEQAKARAEQVEMIKLSDTQYASRLVQWAVSKGRE